MVVKRMPMVQMPITRPHGDLPVALFPPLDFCRMAERASQGGRHAVGLSAFAPSAFVSPPFITQSSAVGRRHAGGARRGGRGHAAAARQSGAAELADEPPHL